MLVVAPGGTVYGTTGPLPLYPLVFPWFSVLESVFYSQTHQSIPTLRCNAQPIGEYRGVPWGILVLGYGLYSKKIRIP